MNFDAGHWRVICVDSSNCNCWCYNSAGCWDDWDDSVDFDAEVVWSSVTVLVLIIKKRNLFNFLIRVKFYTRFLHEYQI